MAPLPRHRTLPSHSRKPPRLNTILPEQDGRGGMLTDHSTESRTIDGNCFFAFLALALLVGACYFIYSRSTAMAAATDEKDLERFMIANRELHLRKSTMRSGIMAIKIAHGDEGVARARYIQLRVQQMKNEADAANAAQQP